MNKIVLALFALIISSPLFAGCNEYALHGDWTVFYEDNSFPTSVLSPDRVISISYIKGEDQFSVDLNDNHWKAMSKTWMHECIRGQTVLIGAIEKRKGGALLMMEISRVKDVNDLLARSSGVLKLNQVNIQFPDYMASINESGLLDTARERGYLAATPGHAHADN